MSQKKKSNISFGPGASSLILIFVVLAMSVLGMLALMNSRSDAQMSNRSMQVTRGAYELNARMEERRAALDALLVKAAADSADDGAYMAALEENLPEDMALRDRTVAWTELTAWAETNGLRQLSCALEIAPLGATPRAEWTRHSLEAVTDEGVIALNARLEKRRAALQKEGKTVSGEEKLLELTSSADSDMPRALVGVLAADEKGQPAWQRRYLKAVTDEDVIALMDRADETWQTLEASLDQAAIDAMQQVVDTTVAGQSIVTSADVDAIYLKHLQKAELPQGITLTDHRFTWQEQEGGLTLDCAVELLPLSQGEEYTAWASRALTDNR